MLNKIIILIITIILNSTIVNATYLYDEELKIATIERKPFSYIENWKWTGFSIDLFKYIAEKNNIKYSYVEYKEFSKMLDSIKDKTNNLAVANISITLEREKNYDFSTPIYDSWLNILWLSKNSKIISFTSKYMEYFIKSLIYIWFFFIILIHFFWIKNLIKWNIYISNYFSSIINISNSIIIQIKNAFWLRILSILLIFSSIFTVSYFSETLTILFNERMGSNIRKETKIYYNEISKNKIGVTNQSTAMTFLNSNNIKTINYNILNDLYIDLEKEKIDYIVADDPILKYYSKKSKIKIFDVIWKKFNHESFGFLFQNDSALLEDINISLLELKEEWKYDDIYNKYFSN